MARPRKFVVSPIPTWACRVRALRQSLGMNQLEFGRILGFSPIVVSRWERGLKKPSAEGFIKMGKMSKRPSGWYFWRLAGVDQQDALRMLGDGH